MDRTGQFEHLKQTYFDECAELLEGLAGYVVTLEPDERDTEKLNSIFRAVHSIKAGAGAFGFDRLVTYTHSFEAVLEKVRSRQIILTEDLTSLLVRAVDMLHDLVTDAQGEQYYAPDHERAVLGRLKEMETGPETAPVAPEAEEHGGAAGKVRVIFQPGETLLRFGNEPLNLLAELCALGQASVTPDLSRLPGLDRFDPEICYLGWRIDLETEASLDEIRAVFEFVSDDCDLSVEALNRDPGSPRNAPEGASAPQRPADAELSGEDNQAVLSQTGAPRTSSIRVDLVRLDRLVNMVGELVIAQSMVLQNISETAQVSDLSQLRGLEDLTLRTRELQESVMAIRMQPVKSVFSRMPRVVRDLSDRLGKKVTLKTRGEETEVDKTVIEELSDPLTHMIRNALDHGLETPEDRVGAGKPETGTIELSAEHRSGRIVICVADDGRGIDREAVSTRAVERGLISADSAATMAPGDIDQLVFAPGFSTAREVSDISGRGVGMDVVRRNIQALGGRIAIETLPGKGTKFILTLPLTLAVLDGMLIMVGTERYILPLTGILECVRPQRRDLRRLGAGQEVLSNRGEFVPLIHLRQRLGAGASSGNAQDALVVLVETESGRKVGLVVDDLLNQQQVVIKSLDENYHSIEGISGATILGDGRVALIIDVDALSGMSGQSGDGGDLTGPTGPGSWFDDKDAGMAEADGSALSQSEQGEIAA